MANNEKERFLKLYKKANEDYLNYLESIDQKGLVDTEGRASYIVDRLLEAGVTLPPAVNAIEGICKEDAKPTGKIDWTIHYTFDDTFINFACNAHTHGMDKYDHLDFQIVLHLGAREVGRILNTLGLRVQAGEKFKDGDMVKGIYEDCDVRLTEFEETGRKVLRVIIPDQLNRFPGEEGCMLPYTNQTLNTEQLSLKRPDAFKKGGFIQ